RRPGPLRLRPRARGAPAPAGAAARVVPPAGQAFSHRPGAHAGGNGALYDRGGAGAGAGRAARGGGRGAVEAQGRGGVGPEGGALTMAGTTTTGELAGAGAEGRLAWLGEPTKGQWLSFSAAWLGWVLDGFDFCIYVMVMPKIAEAFHISAT